MFEPEYNNIIVYKQTKQFYKDFPLQESDVYRRSVDITLNEMEALERNWPRIVVAPIIEKDCVYVAIDYKEKGFNPIILNMSDWRQAGGGVEYGSRAQEEELFRRSNYFKHLHQEYYPFTNCDTIISKNVEFFRYGKDRGYIMMEKPVSIDCVAAPALRFPQINSTFDDFGYEEDKTLMEEKIRTLLYYCAKNGNNCVILSAWGCGAYGCPSKAVAKLFKSVLQEFAGVFRETPFAILYDNYQPFVEVFNSA